MKKTSLAIDRVVHALGSGRCSAFPYVFLSFDSRTVFRFQPDALCVFSGCPYRKNAKSISYGNVCICLFLAELFEL